MRDLCMQHMCPSLPQPWQLELHLLNPPGWEILGLMVGLESSSLQEVFSTFLLGTQGVIKDF